MGEMKCTDESKQPDKPRSSSRKPYTIDVILVYHFTVMISLERVSKICQSKHKWLLEAKIGKYKLYDISIISLARKNEWVADEVCTLVIEAQIDCAYKYFIGLPSACTFSRLSLLISTS